jgi:hypothetical protein
MTQDNVVEQGRQTVRKKGWWTHVKKISSVPSRYVISPGQQAFKHRLLGRCFKCFAYDHRVAQCRDPTCCWVCKKWGHSSVACPRKRALGNTLPPPTLPFSLASALASSVRPSRASFRPTSKPLWTIVGPWGRGPAIVHVGRQMEGSWKVSSIFRAIPGLGQQ